MNGTVSVQLQIFANRKRVIRCTVTTVAYVEMTGNLIRIASAPTVMMDPIVSARPGLFGKMGLSRLVLAEKS
jgi:hypothetical protein